MSVVDRFMKFVHPVTESGCWIWMGHTNRDGYGRFMVHPKVKNAHRVAYELFRAKIPVGLEIDHLCRVRCCVNPDHMEVVTHYVNSSRRESRPYQTSRSTHCKNGHEFGLDNKGKRACRICANARAMRYYYAKQQ